MARDPRYPYRDFDVQLIESNKETLNAATDNFEEQTGVNAVNILVPDLNRASTITQSEGELVIQKFAPEYLSNYRRMCREYDRGTSILILVVHKDGLLGIYHIKRVPVTQVRANPTTTRSWE